jgi:hypothetical protein
MESDGWGVSFHVDVGSGTGSYRQHVRDVITHLCSVHKCSADIKGLKNRSVVNVFSDSNDISELWNIITPLSIQYWSKGKSLPVEVMTNLGMNVSEKKTDKKDKKK